jgi:hypothetical protein
VLPLTLAGGKADWRPEVAVALTAKSGSSVLFANAPNAIV